MILGDVGPLEDKTLFFMYLNKQKKSSLCTTDPDSECRFHLSHLFAEVSHSDQGNYVD